MKNTNQAAKAKGTTLSKKLVLRVDLLDPAEPILEITETTVKVRVFETSNKATLRGLYDGLADVLLAFGEDKTWTQGCHDRLLFMGVAAAPPQAAPLLPTPEPSAETSAAA